MTRNQPSGASRASESAAKRTERSASAPSSLESGSVDVLIDHIVEHIHAPTRLEIPRLLAEMEAALDVAADDDSALEEMSAHVGEIARELLDHMDKEEAVLFPWIRAGRGNKALAPIRALNGEHAHTKQKLSRVRELRLQMASASAAGASEHFPQAVLTFLGTLESFEARLFEHMRLEDDVLFLRTLQGW